MKRLFFVLTLAALVFSAPPSLFANIDNLSNMSVEWMRTGNRNAATDRADAVVYNPAGIIMLEDGISINMGNQSLFRRPRHSFDLGAGEKTYEQDGDDFFLPSLYAAFKRDDWAVWGGVYIPGGGAVVDYPNGSFSTQLIGMGMTGQNITLPGGGSATITGFSNDWLKAESCYRTATLGGTYKVADWVSLAAGVRYINVKNSIEAGMTTHLNAGGTSASGQVGVDYEQTGDGTGFILGVDFFPTEGAVFAIQYQSRVDLDLDIDVNRDDTGLYAPMNGTETPRDFPAVLGLGLGYDLTDRLYLEANYSYWFQEDADWGRDNSGRDISGMAGDAQSFGLTASYQWTKNLLTSIGAVRTDFLWNNRDGYYMANVGSYEVLYSDNWQLCGGVSWQITSHVEVTLAYARTIWDDADLVYTHPLLGNVNIRTENRSDVVALGMNLSF